MPNLFYWPIITVLFSVNKLRVYVFYYVLQSLHHQPLNSFIKCRPLTHFYPLLSVVYCIFTHFARRFDAPHHI